MKYLAVLAVLAASLSLAAFAPVSAQDSSPHLFFSNHSDATVSVEIVSDTLSRKLVPVVVLPRGDQTISLPPGKHIVDLKLQNIRPPRVHRFIADIPQSDGLRYKFSAFRLGRYGLWDVNSKVSSNDQFPKQIDRNRLNALSAFKKVCTSKRIVTFRAVVWEDKARAKYFDKINGHLCSDDGKEVFRVGDFFAHYICANNWLDCHRHEEGDFQILPTLYSSEISDDAALQLVHRDEHRMRNIEFRKIRSPKGAERMGNIAEYFYYADRSKP